MLKLQRIQVQLSNRLFKPQTRKLLRVSVSNIVKTTSQAAKYINEQSIEWVQPLQFPMLYNKDYMFQIFDVHQFGYNPNEMIMQGKIVIDSINDTKGTWEIYNSENAMIGYLSAEIVSKVPVALKSIIKQSIKNTVNPEHEAQLEVQKKYKRALRISSIVSRTPTIVLKKAYIEIEVAGQKIKTGTLRSRAGQLVYIEPRNIMLDESKNYEDVQGKVRIYSIKGQGEQPEVVAEGSLELVGFKPAKKIIMKKDGVEVGEVFIQSKIIDKNQMNNNSSSISNSQISAKNQFNSTFQQPKQATHERTKSISPEKSIDYTKLEHFGIMNSSRIIKPSLLDTSMVSTRSARKKNSVVNQNNNIVFPKQRRFMIYQDRQNERVTYLNDRSFQYKTQKTGGRYRGASIGYGEKTDFTRAKKQLPGVGNYKLPSIWDRY